MRGHHGDARHDLDHASGGRAMTWTEVLPSARVVAAIGTTGMIVLAIASDVGI